MEGIGGRGEERRKGKMEDWDRIGNIYSTLREKEEKEEEKEEEEEEEDRGRGEGMFENDGRGREGGREGGKVSGERETYWNWIREGHIYTLSEGTGGWEMEEESDIWGRREG